MTKIDMRHFFWRACIIITALLLPVLSSTPAQAHPLGNFSVKGQGGHSKRIVTAARSGPGDLPAQPRAAPVVQAKKCYYFYSYLRN